MKYKQALLEKNLEANMLSKGLQQKISILEKKVLEAEETDDEDEKDELLSSIEKEDLFIAGKIMKFDFEKYRNKVSVLQKNSAGRENKPVSKAIVPANVDNGYKLKIEADTKTVLEEKNEVEEFAENSETFQPYTKSKTTKKNRAKIFIGVALAILTVGVIDLLREE